MKNKRNIVRSPGRQLEQKPKGRQTKASGYSLFPQDKAWIEQLAESLQVAGYSHANRSYVLREAIRRLMDELSGKNAHQIMADIIDHQSKRR